MDKISKLVSSFALAAIFFITFLVTTKTPIFAQVVINEIFPNPIGDEGGAEWVELYNISSNPSPLSDCTLYMDDSANSQKLTFSDDDFIEKYKVISWDGTWLNNAGDEVQLGCVSYSDIFSYGNSSNAVTVAPKEGFTVGRSPDGSDNKGILSSVTLGMANSSIQVPTATPTGKPTATPVPTSTPTTPPTATLTPKPSIKLTTKPTLLPSVYDTTSDAENNDVDSNILGLRKNLEVSPTSTTSADKMKFGSLVPYGLMTLGVGFLGFSGFSFFLSHKKRYNLRKGKRHES
ncbi:MAG: Chitinase [Candidatus Woesebacteria bacterium GW2011_GWA1_39_8]|uniref:Chitinase n=1 Tax=Candidatus Woesebacteria bacterium GW2011_GWA1_39_8 TaxID=1618552 RepID=A0A0G0PLU8_9BACT|nr:MAG: Chitinase [Candidatus Woesebacteria bacterium GW2011_GWA1_39_8]